ncbi:MAG: SDR family oxidoreductase [Oligoflexia bacterium]|nr:SDR family oxidoreductase [Oligoflexia bacterium]
MRLFLTGGNGEIGAAIRQRFQRAGYEVVAPRSSELDLDDPRGISSYLEASPGSFDAFVHCAGINQPKHFETIPLEEMERVLRINTLSFVRIAQLLSDGLKKRKGGHIVAISSIYGSFSREKRLPYSMSKHALNAAVKTLALELGPHGIYVNSVSPGFIDTELTRRNNDAATIEGFSKRTALRRLGAPADIAEVAFFLCSDANRYITGQDLIADGGYSVGGFQNA